MSSSPAPLDAAAPIVNVAAYKFAPLADLKPLRERLIALARSRNLKGTILLSTEGINLFVAGAREGVDALLAELRSIAGLENLPVKISESARQPFSRMLVRIKKEIIAFGVEGIDPARKPAPKISPQELKRWLDEGRPVTLLDTRNDYEIKLGTFRGAVTVGIDHFREFPNAVVRLPEELKQQPVVMFCTGGIRCEKAGPFMEREGYEQIHQLDGGILKYFEECGAAHYDGECFVFDYRVGLDPSLRETESDQCYACQTPLTAEDQQDARFVKGVSCPYCFAPGEEQRARALAARQRALRAAVAPLPGSIPYHNYRPLIVPAAFDRATLLDFLCGIFAHVPREHWAELCASGRILDVDERPVPAEHRVRGGERYLNSEPATTEPDVNAAIRIVHEDEAFIVLHKPAPLPLHPSGRFNRNTLQSILQTVYAPQKPRPAHRLDANTSGLVVFSRTRHFAGLLQPQFAEGSVEKIYLARVVGLPREEEFFCDAPIGAETLEAGLRTIDLVAGLPSRTEFKTLHRFDDGTTLLEVRPLTGRTNQIRIHLWHLGFPICGDRSYLTGHRLGEMQTHAVDDPPLCLLAHRLSFRHPLTGERLEFTSELPEWAAAKKPD
ncbi:MAG: sulfurtransferase [Planctomycetia bacterium]|nr:sulfurtransferase [Planctomycetia bacterium]